MLAQAVEKSIFGSGYVRSDEMYTMYAERIRTASRPEYSSGSGFAVPLDEERWFQGRGMSRKQRSNGQIRRRWNSLSYGLGTFIALCGSMADADPAADISVSDLTAAHPTLSEITVTAQRLALLGTAQTASEGLVTDEELQILPAYRPGQLFETVPGLIVTSHSGEGKANQYLMRGYNLDHGTDLETYVDGMPINQPTHAHGQGYTPAQSRADVRAVQSLAAVRDHHRPRCGCGLGRSAQPAIRFRGQCHLQNQPVSGVLRQCLGRPYAFHPTLR